MRAPSGEAEEKPKPLHRGWTAVGAALAVFAALEFVVVSWCTLAPIWDLLPQLQTLHDWLSIYSVSLSNVDLWFATGVRSLAVLAMASLAPTRRTSRYSATEGKVHPKLRLAVSILTSLFEAAVMGKAAVVAVAAPEQAWPAPPEAGGGAGPPPLDVRFPGLVYMFTSLVVAMVCSLVQSGLANATLSHAQALYEEPPEPGSVEAPLLGGAAGGGGAAAAAAGSSSAAAGADGKAAAAGGVAVAGGPGKGKDGKGKDGKEGDKAKPKVKTKTVLMLLKLSAPDWPTIAVAFGFGLLAALAQATIPYYTGLVIDYASIEPDRAKFQRTIVALLLVAAACGVATGCRGGLFTVAMSRLNVRLRKQLFHSLLQMEVGFFDVTKTGEITSRLAADTSTVSDQVCLNMNVMLRSMTQAAIVLSFMFVASWRLTVVTFIVVPAVMTISKVYGRYFASLAKRVQGELAEANSVAEEVLSSMTTVKAHAAQDSAEAAYAAKLSKFFSLLLKEALVYAGYMVANTFLPSAVAALVLFYGGRLVLAGQMSPGALVSFMLYQQSLSSAFQMLGDVFSALTAAVGAADKVLELMARKPQVDAGGQLVPSNFVGHIELKDVHFHYPARPHHPVLRGLNLAVEPGQVVALVGPSGGGKSSIVKLVERFYLPQSGAVLLDGRDVGVYNSKWLRRQVALVSQEPVLYGRSIRRNIMYGLEAEDGELHPPTQEDIEEAAKQANAHDFICSFPDGYETDCGEKGVTLSGGQKQRLAIARALVRRPRVLLLDEATSALDADSEAVVQEALDRVMDGRTVLVIAHRLSTIQEADKIFVIAGGVVQEVGTHVELLANSGVYATLVRRQIAKSVSLASLTSHAGTGAPP